MARKSFFVTGTDTGVGKTLVSAAILQAGNRQGLRTLGMKPIASGCEITEAGLRNEDALMLQESMSEVLPYDQINPIALEPAIAPHVAAAQAGRVLGAQRLAGFVRGIQMQPADLLLVEGAGGWRVPLNDGETYASVPMILELPVIMVVPLKLGCINHAMLTAEAIRRDGLQLAGWVANRPDQDVMSCESETLSYLLDHIPAPCLGVLSWQAQPDPAALAEGLDLDPLFRD